MLNKWAYCLRRGHPRAREALQAARDAYQQVSDDVFMHMMEEAMERQEVRIADGIELETSPPHCEPDKTPSAQPSQAVGAVEPVDIGRELSQQIEMEAGAPPPPASSLQPPAPPCQGSGKK